MSGLVSREGWPISASTALPSYPRLPLTMGCHADCRGSLQHSSVADCGTAVIWGDDACHRGTSGSGIDRRAGVHVRGGDAAGGNQAARRHRDPDLSLRCLPPRIPADGLGRRRGAGLSRRRGVKLRPALLTQKFYPAFIAPQQIPDSLCIVASEQMVTCPFKLPPLRSHQPS